MPRRKQEGMSLPSQILDSAKGTKAPRHRAWADRVARAAELATPAQALCLSADLQLLARVCRVLAAESDGPFKLGTAQAGALVGGDSFVGSEALALLAEVGVIRRKHRGTKETGCSTWEWTAKTAVAPALPRWITEAFPRGDARAAHVVGLN